MTQSFLLVRPATRPVAAVALFAGGNGALNLGTPRLGLAGNFLVRSRARFAGHGLLVAVVDTPSDHPEGLDGFRASPGHAADVRAVIAAPRAEAATPVWLVGTSMGTVSAANAASRLAAGGGSAGLVLTSTVTRQGRERPESVGDVRLRDIRVPTLVVHHRDDACRGSPYADVPALMRDLTSAPRRGLLTFEGGAAPQSGPCEARSAHATWAWRPRWWRRSRNGSRPRRDRRPEGGCRRPVIWASSSLCYSPARSNAAVSRGSSGGQHEGIRAVLAVARRAGRGRRAAGAAGRGPREDRDPLLACHDRRAG